MNEGQRAGCAVAVARILGNPGNRRQSEIRERHDFFASRRTGAFRASRVVCRGPAGGRCRRLDGAPICGSQSSSSAPLPRVMPPCARSCARRGTIATTAESAASMQFKLGRRRGIGNRADHEARGHRDSEASPLKSRSRMRQRRTLHRARPGLPLRSARRRRAGQSLGVRASRGDPLVVPRRWARTRRPRALGVDRRTREGPGERTKAEIPRGRRCGPDDRGQRERQTLQGKRDLRSRRLVPGRDECADSGEGRRHRG